MTLFFYMILAIGFIVGLIVLFSVMTSIGEKEKDETAHRDAPPDEQQHDVRNNTGKSSRQ